MLKVDTNIGGYTKVIDGKITMVAPEVLDLIWPQILPILEESREWWQDYYEMEDIKSLCRDGSMQMWVGVTDKKIFAMGLTSIGQYPRCRILKCIFLAGSGAKTILPCLKEIEQWAAMYGATRSEIIGRDAWLRLAAPYGYVKSSIVMRKQIASQSNRRH